MATNAPVEHLLSADDVLPAEGVQALGDSVDTSIDVLAEQHDAYGQIRAIHGKAPPVMVAIAGILVGESLAKPKTVKPKPFWGASWGPNILEVSASMGISGTGMAITVVRGCSVVAAKAFVKSTLDPTAGAGVGRSDKWKALFPSCYVDGGGAWVAFPNLVTNQQYFSDVDTLFVMLFGHWT